MEAFFQSIAYPMTPPTAYGLFHILFTVIGFALSAFVAWKLRHVSEKTAGRILFLCGLVLTLSEIFKQFFCYFIIEESTYHWGEFPFQLCSVPMYLCLLAPFVKEGKLRRAMYSFMVLYNLLGGGIAFMEPSGLFHEYLFLTAHSCCWHMMLVFVGLFLCMSKRGGDQKSDYAYATQTFLVLCAVAFGINCAVQFGLGEEINMFFIGPGNSSIIVFKQISEWLGWYVNTPIYIGVLSFGAYLVFSIVYRAHNKVFPFAKEKTATK